MAGLMVMAGYLDIAFHLRNLSSLVALQKPYMNVYQVPSESMMLQKL